jgi:hypothetical protein
VNTVVRFVAPREFGMFDLRERPDLVAGNVRYMAVFLLRPDEEAERLASGMFSVSVHQNEMGQPKSFVDALGEDPSWRARVVELPAGPAALVTELVAVEPDKSVLQSHAILADGPRTVQLTIATEDTGDWPGFAAVFERLLQTVSFA